MSDPVTNVEIEDVLSSIRRLVTEGEKARRDANRSDDLPAETVSDDLDVMPDADAPLPSDAAIEVAETEAPGKDDLTERLLLTPALRVAEPADAPTALAEEPAEPAPETEPESDRASLEATIAELEAAVVAQGDDWEPDGSEVAQTTPQWPTSEEQDPVSDADDMALPQDLDQPMAEFAPIEEPGDDDTVVALSEDMTDASDEPARTDADLDVVLSLVTPPAPEDTPADTTADVAGEDTVPDDRSDFDAGPEDAALAFRHLAAPDHVAANDLTGAAAVDDDETLEAFLARGGGVDEEALRRMVMEIVREELQGPLGERITRNVRKLVRREIMRVLNAQDMD